MRCIFEVESCVNGDPLSFERVARLARFQVKGHFLVLNERAHILKFMK